MANLLYVMGKRMLISSSRGTVRGSVIFVMTHLLFALSIVFAAQVALILLGIGDIYVPVAGQLIEWVRQVQVM